MILEIFNFFYFYKSIFDWIQKRIYSGVRNNYMFKSTTQISVYTYIVLSLFDEFTV